MQGKEALILKEVQDFIRKLTLSFQLWDYRPNLVFSQITDSLSQEFLFFSKPIFHLNPP